MTWYEGMEVSPALQRSRNTGFAIAVAIGVTLGLGTFTHIVEKRRNASNKANIENIILSRSSDNSEHLDIWLPNNQVPRIHCFRQYNETNWSVEILPSESKLPPRLAVYTNESKIRETYIKMTYGRNTNKSNH